jgi:dTDP-4-dehydrorhamnose 3,5-epimerase-like enzyme
MPKLFRLPTFTDHRGHLTVIEKVLPFEIKRVYFIYNTKGKERGFHSHKRTKQALIAVSGNCEVNVKDQANNSKFTLDSPKKCLLLDPNEFHWMNNFSTECVLLVLASHEFDPNDYINETDT